MKHKAIHIVIGLAICLSACFDDNSSFGGREISDVEIDGLKDTTIISLMNNVLAISPEVVSTYPENSLSYTWYLYNNTEYNLENGYRENPIAHTKDLNYEVNLAPGNYTIVFEVINTDNNYIRTATMQLTTVTSFSEGFYILKETTDGQTDLDVYGSGELSQDVIFTLHGERMSGTPANLSVSYNQAYIDTETQQMATSNMVHVFTETNQYKGFRTEDMSAIFDNESIRFDGIDEGEKLYTIVRGSSKNFLFTSNGLYGLFGGETELSSGIFGMPTEGGSGASKFFVPTDTWMGTYYYWNNEAHTLYTTDQSALSVFPVDYDKTNVDESNFICLACGFNAVGGSETTGFICEDQVTKDRYLYLEVNLSGITIQRLDPNLHVSKGEIVAFSAMQGTYIYSVDNNQVWAYNWEENNEIKIPLPGIPESETITYLSNQYWQEGPFGNTANNFNYLIVSTQDGDNYKLYFYESLIGGVPEGTPRVLEGTGKVKCVRFVSNVRLGFADFFLNSGDPLIFPYFD